MAFKKLYIEITNVCNLRCPFCAESGRSPEFMAAEKFALALDRLAPLGGHIYPHVLGEPLLHPELGEILDICRAKGRPVNLTTNGRLLGSRSGLLLYSPALRLVSVSLHSAGDESADAALCLLEDALSFARARLSGRPYVTLRLWRGSEGLAVAAMEELRRRFPDMEAVARSGHEAYRLAPGLFLDLAQPFQWPSAGRAGSPRKSCPGLTNQLAVLADGTVVPCCLDARGELALGNLFESSIDEILASPRASTIRAGFASGRAAEPLCAGCSGKP